MIVRPSFLQPPPQHPKDSRRWLSLVLSALLVLLLLGVVLWICHTKEKRKAEIGNAEISVVSSQLSALSEKPSIEIRP
jgi:hypothetical protein